MECRVVGYCRWGILISDKLVKIKYWENLSDGGYKTLCNSDCMSDEYIPEYDFLTSDVGYNVVTMGYKTFFP